MVSGLGGLLVGLFVLFACFVGCCLVVVGA